MSDTFTSPASMPEDAPIHGTGLTRTGMPAMGRAGRVLIIGIDSQIGAALRNTLEQQGVAVYGTSRQAARCNERVFFFDLAQPAADLPLSAVDCVIVCAAISSIALCEEQPHACERVNVTNTIALIDQCVAAGCFVIFLSSNAVFDGSRAFATRLDTPAPASNYGRFKLAVESHVLAQTQEQAAILRLTKVIGEDTAFLARWHSDARAGAPIRAYTNKLLSPVALADVAASIALLIDWRQGGLYQLGGHEELSFFDYAQRHFAADPAALALIQASGDPAAPSGSGSHNSLMTHMPNTCHACHQHALQAIPSDTGSHSVTSDCRPWPHPIRLAVCAACGLVQKQVSPAYIRQTQEIYQSYAIYKQSDGAEQSVFTHQGTEFARSDKIIGWLNDSATLGATGKLLEIGCGNGAFLKKFSGDKPQWHLLGTEFDDKNRHLVESIPHARLHCGDLKNIADRFDLIVAIHLLEHIFDPLSLLHECATKLNDGGKIFLQVPNIKESPFDILIADHCSHFSIESLTALLTQGGFEILAVSDTNVQKELSLLVRPRRAEQALDTARSTSMIAGYLGFFAALKSAGLAAGDTVGIFGSSISATWLASELDGKVKFFIDEDSNRIGKTHLGLPIIAVNAVPAGAVVLLPMNPKIARSIVDRLASHRIHFILPS